MQIVQHDIVESVLHVIGQLRWLSRLGPLAAPQHNATAYRQLQPDGMIRKLTEPSDEALPRPSSIPPS